MEYKHFSHPHNLRIYQVQHGNEYSCSACELIISGSAYGCWECKFFLHEQCGNASRAMQHTSHPMHHLTLVPTTTYSAGNFLCNACGEPGSAFSFCCPLCDFDLHVQCAFLPEILIHDSHFHSLSLSYALPAAHHYESSSYVCDICHKQLDQKCFWSYNCFACNFHVHVSCTRNLTNSASAKPEPNSAAYQKEESASGSSQQNQTERTEIEDPVLEAQLELQRLQLEMQMAQELAKMMSSFNLSSLVWNCSNLSENLSLNWVVFNLIIMNKLAVWGLWERKLFENIIFVLVFNNLVCTWKLNNWDFL